MLAPRKKLWSTPLSVIAAAQSLIGVLLPTDVVYDVGCGDGRVLLTLALSSPPGTTFFGIEIDADRAREAEINISAGLLAAGQTNAYYDVVSSASRPRVTVECRNAMDVDYSAATAVFLYLVPRGLRIFKPVLLGGGRLVNALGPYTEGGPAAAAAAAVAACKAPAEEGSSSVATTAVADDEAHSSIPTDDAPVAATLPPPPPPPPPPSGDSGVASAPVDDLPSTTLSSSSASSSPSVLPPPPSLRVVTYMSGFADEHAVRKVTVPVEHQEGAAWPVYLYHFQAAVVAAAAADVAAGQASEERTRVI